MTATLTSSEQELVGRMAQGRDRAEWGFELLLERRADDLAKFFEPLKEAGLFQPRNNLGPTPAEQEGYVHIPFWPALKYLDALAKESRAKNNLSLAEQVMSIVRSVSKFRDPDGSGRDNYHTFRVFAEILGKVPAPVVSLDDLELLPVWLSSRYDRGWIASELDKGFIRRALQSESSEEWDKACRVLYHCTAIEWVEERGYGERGKRKPVSIVEDYWLAELIRHNAESLGKNAGRRASDVFAARLKELFDPARNSAPSYWSRPAIEENDQNTPIDEAGDRFIEGLRDVIMHWVDHDPSESRDYVRAMLIDDAEVLRRIAIHTINNRWAALRGLYLPVVSPGFFSDAHLHELYELLKSHFGEFTDNEKSKTLEAIRNLQPEEGEEAERWLKRTQRNWLSAICNKGYEQADRWHKELEADPTIGSLSKYPSLHSYHESWSGPGPSPYTVPQLLQHAEAGTLIDALNAFSESNGWQSPETPTIRALVDVLSEAVKMDPMLFVTQLPTFLGANRPFQYGVINAFKQFWGDSEKGDKASIDWALIWRALFEFFTALLCDDAFWKENVKEDRTLTPNRDWIPPLIAEVLKAGTQNDEHAYPEHFLPQAWRLINVLLEQLAPETEPSDDPMTYAINSRKGKAVEALFSHALRVCRVTHKATGQHADVWNVMMPTFEREMDKCKNGNYEMSTLTGAYIANINYMSQEWLQRNIKIIFPEDNPTNFICAVDGIAYAPATRNLYKLLIEGGVIDNALRLSLKGRHTREKLIQRIALAYLWKDETLNGPRIYFLFDGGLEHDLQEMGDFFWSVSGQKLDLDQVELVLLFWSRCIDWSKTRGEPPAALLSSLSKLAFYVKAIGAREKEWLMAVAPYVHVGHDADRFIEELDRLADANVREVSEILCKVLETYKPVFDYEDRIKLLIEKIARSGGDEKLAAIAFADKLCKLGLRGMCDLFKKLQG